MLAGKRCTDVGRPVSFADEDQVGPHLGEDLLAKLVLCVCGLYWCEILFSGDEAIFGRVSLSVCFRLQNENIISIEKASAPQLK